MIIVCHICIICLTFNLTSLMSTPAPFWKARSIIQVVLWPSHNWRWSWIISWKHSITEPLLADSTFAKPKYDLRAPTSHFLWSSSKAIIFFPDLLAWTGIPVPCHTQYFFLSYTIIPCPPFSIFGRGAVVYSCVFFVKLNKKDKYFWKIKKMAEIENLDKLLLVYTYCIS